MLEDQFGFVLHHAVMWQGADVDYAVPMVKAGQGRFPELRAASFDRGFHSPDNRQRLDAMLDCAALLKKGRLGQADRERESEPEFMAMRRRHPAVESAINGLEHRGLDRVRTHGAEGFARTVALAVLAANLHRLGRLRPRFRIIPLRRLPHSAPQQPKNEGFLADTKLPTASQTLSNPTHL